MFWSCDGQTCNQHNVPFGTVLPANDQVAGDCLVGQCNGSGGDMTVVDDADVPPDDGNDCTAETCNNGVPDYPAWPLDHPCSANGGQYCDGLGACVECNSPNECPDPGVTCKQADCTANACGVGNVAQGTPAPDGLQTPADCRVVACDGAGGTEVDPDDADVEMDGNECTQDVCSGGVPQHTAEAAGTPCALHAGWMCNGNNPAPACVECLDGGDCPAPATCDVAVGRCQCPAVGVGTLLLSELRLRGPAGGNDEFVELYNAANVAVALTNQWRIKTRSDAAGSYTTRFIGSGQVVLPHSHFLIVGSAYAGSVGSTR